MPVRAHDNLRIFRRLIWRIDSGEVADLSRARFLVEILRIALFADCQRRIDKDFDKLRFAFERNLARAAAIAFDRAK